MANKTNETLSVLGIEDTIIQITAAVKSDTPYHLIGSPGIGKSTIIAALAKKLGMPLETLILSICDPTDIGGFPVAAGGRLDRLALGAIKRACEAPCILFLDELSCAPPAVQAAALQLIFGRYAGDSKLHDGTRIIAASNPADQAAGGWDLALPLIGRMTQQRLEPQMKEVQSFFFALGKDETTLHRLAVDFGATLEADPSLLQINPPPGAQSAGSPWGAPRSWHRALMLCSALVDDEYSENGKNFAAALSGNVGDDAAAAYMAIRKIRNNLPTIAQIISDPNGAQLPKDIATGAAVIGILAQVGLKDPCAAYIYADRLKDEIRIVSARVLCRREFSLKVHAAGPTYKEAVQARARILKSIGTIFKDE
jgi:AAA domain (dynein-related subfamily)